MSESILNKGDQRRESILQHLKSQGRITVQYIIEEFGCSEATARRDLEVLANREPVVRTLGGAQYEGFSTAKETSFFEKKAQYWTEKEAIAERAASLIEKGDIIGLTGGSTTYLISRAIKHMQGITVVTNAVNVAMELAESEGIQVVVTGGVLRNNSFELCGPLAERMVEHIHIGKMFIGIDGFSVNQGLTTYSEQEAHIAQLLIRRSAFTAAVFDHTKVGRSSLFSIAPIRDIHACITNQPLPEPFERILTERNVNIYLPHTTTEVIT
ncbi:DeoR faimly transcriptional regulator [Paenibacillus swuensis]|uniref:DeoR faimly transcriptional regulator n=1 Tax=Paenibacillus swuensis TaxID=1178515 RepID=A0A172TLA5_9BACL|nr:DeoR/GlpR family DNA-binding transcription regulator [Paenibacillus swuensis]ANE47810.1 DeoR faimly transcriptional regulator [Paenibacillus swuensis]